MIKILLIAVVGFLLIVVLLVWLGARILTNRFEELVQSGFEKYPLQEGNLISETDIAHLPAIVQKYMCRLPHYSARGIRVTNYLNC